MFSQFSSSKMDKAMNPDQFDQVVEAILAGKYSWACVLILRFAGYNPLHYIPYRTYNRLIKDNLKASQSNREQANCASTNSQSATSGSKEAQASHSLSKIRDLNYLQNASKQSPAVRGGLNHLQPDEALLNFR